MYQRNSKSTDVFDEESAIESDSPEHFEPDCVDQAVEGFYTLFHLACRTASRRQTPYLKDIAQMWGYEKGIKKKMF